MFLLHSIEFSEDIPIVPFLSIFLHEIILHLLPGSDWNIWYGFKPFPSFPIKRLDKNS